MFLPPLEAEPLAEYLTSRFERSNKDITEAALGAVLDLVEGHPQRAMAAAHALWNAAARIADLDQWETARSFLRAAVEDELKTAWVELSSMQRKTLVAVSLGSPPRLRRLVLQQLQQEENSMALGIFAKSSLIVEVRCTLDTRQDHRR